MKKLRHLCAIALALVLVLGILPLPSMAAGIATCTGKFPNPITDICWSCILPISIGSARIGNFGGQEDIDNPSSPVCTCGVNPVIGLSVGFWEPARHVEAVRKPFCLTSLGGIDLDPGIPAPEAARFTRSEGDGDGGSFYQAHYYTNPILYWLEVVADFPCLEKGSFDLAYLTEVDPLWNDDELTLILNPDAVLFANPVAGVADIHGWRVEVRQGVTLAIAGAGIRRAGGCSAIFHSAVHDCVGYSNRHSCHGAVSRPVTGGICDWRPVRCPIY